MSTGAAQNYEVVLRLDDARVTWVEIDGDIVAVDMNTAEYLTVNGAGAVLWRVLVSGASRRDLAARLVDVYGIDTDQAQTDTSAFVDELSARGLIADAA